MLLGGCLAIVGCASRITSLEVTPSPSGASAGPSSENVTAETAPPLTRPDGSEQPTGPAPQAAAPAEVPTSDLPWPSGTKVLQVGDSFAGALGIPLGKKLETVSVRSILVAKDASYLTDWAWDGNLQKQIWKFNPDLVLVTLGANELGISTPNDRAKTIQKIVAILANRPCVWVAIPLWNGPQNGLLEVIRQNVGHCVYLDTNALIDTSHMQRIKDGVHPTAAARDDWAELVLTWLKEHRAPTTERVWNVRP